MEVHFTPDTEAQIRQLAASRGKDAVQVVEETITRVLERRAKFRAAVCKGIAEAVHAELVEDEEVRVWLEERERS